MAIPKQDRQGARTPADLERKYNLGGSTNGVSTAFLEAKLNMVNERLNELTNLVAKEVEELEGNNQTWFYSGIPTLETHPSVDWATDELKASHIGDLYYDIDDGNIYIFKVTEGVYAWESCFGGGVDYDTAYNEGYEKGFTDGQEESVPNYLYYARLLNNAFGGVVFSENFNFVLKTKGDFARSDSIAYIFNNSRNLKSVKFVSESLDFVLDMTSSFAIAWDGTPTIELIDLTEFNKKFSKLFNTFRYQKVLKSILGKMDLSECTNTTNTFQNCEALEDVEFESETIKISISFAQSSKLSANSIQSIIDGLATVETTQTLSLNSNVSTLTDEQYDSLFSKNWQIQ